MAALGFGVAIRPAHYSAERPLCEAAASLPLRPFAVAAQPQAMAKSSKQRRLLVQLEVAQYRLQLEPRLLPMSLALTECVDGCASLLRQEALATSSISEPCPPNIRSKRLSEAAEGNKRWLWKNLRRCARLVAKDAKFSRSSSAGSQSAVAELCSVRTRASPQR